jgi:hypothetical protein
VNTDNATNDHNGTPFPSVQYQLNAYLSTTWHPFVTSINMLTTNDCKAYIDKLAFISSNYSSGQLIISANSGGYTNTNYYFEGSGDSPAYPLAFEALEGVTSNGVLRSAVDYDQTTNYVHITNGTNVAGYFSRGYNGGLGSTYSIDGTVDFSGNGGWYIIETAESFNGQIPVQQFPQGTFTQWFFTNAFSGTNFVGANYLNTPVGAVTHVEEPYTAGVENPQVYFGLWAAGKTFSISAWAARNTPYFQAVGDPFTRR